MPKKAPRAKLKTHRATAKRFWVTASGKLLRRKQLANHLRRNKSPRAKRTYHQKLPVSSADARRIHALLPYA
ncbi:MAG: 50S ribosomal protein L35 [Dehalococcoidia bacterium]|nr:50S ribosomal protein L35 [Dehalococcoidia bacterium]MDW8119510.1 50S ribosomal protein L35 [Chloroflexota bacterium]